MMSNPQMMQASMQMAQAMMGNNTPQEQGGAMSGANLMAPNPMAAIMQQMMAPLPAADAAEPPVPAGAELNPMVRVRFASQLLQHQGRVDAAIDTLLSSPDGSA